MPPRDGTDDQLRRELRDLGRRMLRGRHTGRPLPELPEAPPGAHPPLPSEQPAIVSALGGEAVEAPIGELALRVRLPLDQRAPHLRNLCREYAELIAGEGIIASRLRHMANRPHLALEDIVFFDLETTGLSGTPLFLIGVMGWEDDGLVVTQYFARDYREEAAVLSLFVDDLSRRSLLVSFNGLSFDWPFVASRVAATGLPPVEAPPHLDLLVEARRVWRLTVPDCKLQTLEVHICGHSPRTDDIPGSEIPAAYDQFVRTGDPAQMLTVLKHNYQDLVTLAELLVKLPS